MTTTSTRRFGARGLALLAMTASMSSTPGMAVIPGGIGAVETSVEAPKPDFSSPVFQPVAELPAEDAEHLADGSASYYGHELAGNRTASGERFNPRALTAAHRTLPLGTKLKVTNKSNGKSVVVRVNDRGPFVKKRLIDLSLAAAQEIGMVRSGHANVRIDRLR